jgi:hypothetical protein
MYFDLMLIRGVCYFLNLSSYSYHNNHNKTENIITENVNGPLKEILFTNTEKCNL